MRKIATAIYSLSFILSAGPSLAHSEANVNWPGDAKAAVALTYDDGLNSQLDNAVPALNKYGLKATFFITPSFSAVNTRLDDWRRVSRSGHQLGNHTLFHPCRGSRTDGGDPRYWLKSYYDLDRYAVDQMVAELEIANLFLRAIDGRNRRSFAFTCGDMTAGGEDYVSAIRPLFIAARSSNFSVLTSMEELDPYEVPSLSPDGSMANEMIDYVEATAKHGTLAVLTFHGIGGDHMRVDSQEHEKFLKYLSENLDTYWIDTFDNIMHFVKESTE